MKRLRMKFYDPVEKKSKTISIDGVIDDLTQDDVEPVMEGLIGVLVPASSLVDEASIVETTTEEIFNLIEN
ncbi:MAG: DUF2922 domain-containing protein [Defluviitoga tunisiensis]|nr:DUF2922 domain-containing protein [Defluviitoga tunisiensis]